MGSLLLACRIALAVGAGLAPSTAPETQGQEAAHFSEYEVKAAFLVKFAMFVEWPARAFAQGDSPVTIGVLGEDPFGPEFEKGLRREVAAGRRFVLKRSHKVQELQEVQILFISSGEKARLPEILEALQGRPVLTVADQERFAHRGGMINFMKEGPRIRFEINAAAIQAAGLKPSSKLMQVALPVVTDAGKEAR